MTFLVTLIALLIERFFDWSHLRHWSWFNLYQRKIVGRLEKQSSFVLLAIAILPPILLIALIQFSLKGVLYGFLSLVFEILIVLYCFGPQNLWADAFACINALSQSDTQTALQKFAVTFGVNGKRLSHERLIDKIFIASHSRVFAIIFWFVLLGPVGAVLYRAISLTVPQTTHDQGYPQLIPAGRLSLKILDWLPVRVFTFLFALGGHFAQVLSLWRKEIFSGINNNERILKECGIAALGREELGNATHDGSAEKNAISLLDRVFIIVLVLIAISVLIT